jgi:ABC-type glycerol-3-phosphate transport system substrate-binding protein
MKRTVLQFLSAATAAVAFLYGGCSQHHDPNRIIIWHQMRVDERLVLADQLKQFMAGHPGVKVEEIYKETEELRSGFIVAAIAKQGPDLVRSEEHTSELQSP